MSKLKIQATYKSGRIENYFVKKTKGRSNKELDKILKNLNGFPTIQNVIIIDMESPVND